MGIVDWIRGYSTTREVHAVFDEDGNMGPAHAVTSFYDLDGKYLKSSIGGDLTDKERDICEENPDVVMRSPFSYDSSGCDESLVRFAKDVSRLLE